MARNQKFALERGGPKRVEIAWKGMWKQVTTTLDGEALGEPIPNFKALKQGRTYPMPGGGELLVKFEQKSFGGGGLMLLHNGRALPGSGADPRTKINTAAGICAFVAGFSMLLGLLGVAGVELLANLGFGWPSMLVGALMGGLAWLVWKKRSALALGVAIGVLVADTVLSVVVMMDAGGGGYGGIYMRVLFVIVMVQGFMAIKAANAEDLLDAQVKALE